MTYSVKEVFVSLQGEGSRVGCKSVFVRFSGCNLWSGDPSKREGAGPCAEWCDTDFFKGTKMSAAEIADEADRLWPEEKGRWVVFTGGEPALQLDVALVLAFRDRGWKLAIETNGTVQNVAIECCDLITCSPKKGAPINIRRADDLKVVLPGGAEPWTDAELAALETARYWNRLYVQPQASLTDGLVGRAEAERNLAACVEFVMRRPMWRLSVQTHKVAGLR
jgi:organic radical activating enzyme